MGKIILSLNKIEKAFGRKFQKNCIVLGLDTATKTGYCIAKTNGKHISFNIGFINLDVKGIKDRQLRNELRYQEFWLRFKELIKSEYKVVIEDVYFGRNAQTLILLARIGTIAWVLATEKKCEIIWRTAVQARKLLGLPCNKKKEVVMKAVNKALKTKLTNSDEIDAIVLAIGGLIK